MCYTPTRMCHTPTRMCHTHTHIHVATLADSMQCMCLLNLSLPLVKLKDGLSEFTCGPAGCCCMFQNSHVHFIKSYCSLYIGQEPHAERLGFLYCVLFGPLPILGSLPISTEHN